MNTLGPDPPASVAKTVAAPYRPNYCPPDSRVCIRCAYDLSGSPEGTCPECGLEFTWKSLAAEHRAAAERRERRKGAAIGVLIAVILTVLLGPAVPVLLLMVPAVLAIGCVGLCGYLAGSDWARAGRLRFRAVMIVSLPTMLLVWITPSDWGLGCILIGAAAVLMSVLAAARAEQPLIASLAGAAAILGLGPAILGGFIVAGSALGMGRGEYWGHFDWPGPRMPRAMPNRDAIWEGVRIAAWSVPVVIAGLWAASWAGWRGRERASRRGMSPDGLSR